METTTFSQFAKDDEVNDLRNMPNIDFLNQNIDILSRDYKGKFDSKRNELIQLSQNICKKQVDLDELYKAQKELADERSSVEMIVEV